MLERVLPSYVSPVQEAFIHIVYHDLLADKKSKTLAEKTQKLGPTDEGRFTMYTRMEIQSCSCSMVSSLTIKLDGGLW